MPDAVYKVHEANDKHLRYDVKVNDKQLWQYHKNNGFTKLSFKDDSGNETAVLRVIEAHVEAASIVNKAYIKNIFKNVTVMTGINTYPYEPDLDYLIGKT